ncbi:MAG TPA: hypothetical protein VGK99_04685 [Acidobacteriota bacterium]|jgi:hypothetical protein
MISMVFFDSRYYLATLLCADYVRRICQSSLPATIVGMEVLLQERGLFRELWTNARISAFGGEADPMIALDLNRRTAAYRSVEQPFEFHYQVGESRSVFRTVPFEEMRSEFESYPRVNYLS